MYHLVIYHLVICWGIVRFAEYSDDPLRGTQGGQLFNSCLPHVFRSEQCLQAERLLQFFHTFWTFCQKQSQLVSELLLLERAIGLQLRFGNLLCHVIPPPFLRVR